MRRLFEPIQHNNIKNTRNDESKILSIKIPYDLTVILKKYDIRFEDFGKKKFFFDYTKKCITKVGSKSNEREIYTNDRNPFIRNLSQYSNLESIEFNGHTKVETQYLISSSIRHIVINEVDNIKFMGDGCLPSLKTLKIRKCRIDYPSLIFFLRIESLVELHLENVTFKSMINNGKMKKMFKNMKKLRKLSILETEISKEVYFFIVNSLNLNAVEFVKDRIKFSYDSTVQGNLSLHISNCLLMFCHLDFRDIKNLRITDDNFNSEILYSMKLKDLTELSLENIFVDKNFLSLFLFKHTNIKKLSLLGCSISDIIIYNIIDRYKETLRHLNLERVILPFDFKAYCTRRLKNCVVVFGTSRQIILNID